MIKTTFIFMYLLRHNNNFAKPTMIFIDYTMYGFTQEQKKVLRLVFSKSCYYMTWKI